MARLRTALRETTVVIDGGTTNKSFLLDLLDRDEVISASADTGWLDRTDAGTATGPTPVADIALIAAAVDAYESEESLERAGFLASARGGRPRATPRHRPQPWNSTTRARPTSLTVGQIGPRSYRIDGDSGELVVEVERLSEFESRLLLRRPTLPDRHRRGPHRIPRRGGRHQSPHQPGRSGPGPGLVSGRGRCHAGGGGRPGRGRCHARGAGKHEDGNRAARTVRGAGSGGVRHRQQSGRCGRRTAALRAGRRECDGRSRAPSSVPHPAEQRGRGPARRGPRAARRTARA